MLIIQMLASDPHHLIHMLASDHSYAGLWFMEKVVQKFRWKVWIDEEIYSMAAISFVILDGGSSFHEEQKQEESSVNHNSALDVKDCRDW